MPILEVSSTVRLNKNKNYYNWCTSFWHYHLSDIYHLKQLFFKTPLIWETIHHCLIHPSDGVIKWIHNHYVMSGLPQILPNKNNNSPCTVNIIGKFLTSLRVIHPILIHWWTLKSYMCIFTYIILTKFEY